MKMISMLILVCLLISVIHAKPDTKLTPAELIAKHLESVVDWLFNLNDFAFNVPLEPGQ